MTFMNWFHMCLEIFFHSCFIFTVWTQKVYTEKQLEMMLMTICWTPKKYLMNYQPKSWTKMKSIAGSRSPFRADGEHSAECLPHGQPRRRDLGKVPRMDGPRWHIVHIHWARLRMRLSVFLWITQPKMHQFQKSLCPFSRGGPEDSKTPPTCKVCMILSQVMAI